MPYPYILQWSSLLVRKDVVQLVQGILSLHYVPKHRMLSVEVVDILTKRDEKLAPTSTLRPILQCGSDCHGDGAFRFVLETGNELWREVPWGLFAFLRGYEGPNRLASGTRRSGVANLSQEVFRNWLANQYL